MLLPRLASWTRSAAAIIALTVGTAGANAAQACDPPCAYTKITTVVCEWVPYQECVTRYDHCGRPYHAYVTKYRTVHVPVTRWVKVCH